MAEAKGAYIKDFISGIGFLIFSFVVYFMSNSIPDEAALFPKILSVTLGVISIAFLIQVYIKWNKISSAKDAGVKRNATITRKQLVSEVYSMVLPALAILFAIALPVVGFEITAFIFLLVGLFLLGERKPLPLISIPFGTTLILTLIFRNGLNIRLPIGLWPF